MQIGVVESHMRENKLLPQFWLLPELRKSPFHSLQTTPHLIIITKSHRVTWMKITGNFNRFLLSIQRSKKQNPQLILIQVS